MGDCLSEEALLALYFGEGSESAGAHLKSCAVCVRGYRRLRQEMEVITTTLRTTPPRHRVHRPRPGSRLIAVGMAAAVAVFAAGWLTRSRMLMPLSRTSAVIRSTAAVAEGQLAAGGDREVERNAPVPVSYFVYLQEAFADEDGCGQGDSAFNLSCSQNWQAER